MHKLFSMEDYVEEEPTLSLKETDMDAVLQGSDFSDDIEDIVNTNGMVTESIALYSNQLAMISKSASDLQYRELGSVNYLVSVENYKVITDALTSNLGVKKFIPSLEDFSSRHGLEASHGIAMEGFIEFIKSIWVKIKNFFLSFFKKVSQFIKRLSGVNLEMDSYEKYVEALIKKIKNKKLVLGDNKAKLKSDLPSLMASQGTDQFTEYNEVLNQSTRRINRLSMVLKEQYHSTLIKQTEDSLKNIRDAINDALEEATRDNATKESVVDRMNQIKQGLRDTLANHYPSGKLEETQIPVEVRDSILSMSPDVVFKNVTVLSLVDPVSYGEELPKQFNAFLAMDTDNRSFITTHSEANTYVNGEIPPIGTIESIESFHRTYKDFVKSYNVKDSSNLLTKLERSITDMINFMMGKYATSVNMLDVNLKNQETIGKYEGTDPFERLYHLFQLPDALTKDIKNDKERKKFLDDLRTIIENSMSSTNEAIATSNLSYPGVVNDNKSNLLISSGSKFTNFIDLHNQGFKVYSEDFRSGDMYVAAVSRKDAATPKFRRALVELIRSLSESDSSVSTTLDEGTKNTLKAIDDYVEQNKPKHANPQEILDELADIQNVVLPFLNTFKSHIVSTATALTTIYTDTRGASIKYIYDSARLYH